MYVLYRALVMRLSLCTGYSSCMSTSARSLSPAVPVGPPIASASGVLRSTLLKQAPGVGLHFNVKNIIKVLAGVDYLKLPCLAVELDLTDILGEIEAAPVPDQARKRLATKWHQRCPPGIASRGWEILANALRSPIVGENRLASDLEWWCVRRDSGASTLSSSSGSEPYSPSSPISVGSISTKERGIAMTIYIWTSKQNCIQIPDTFIRVNFSDLANHKNLAHVKITM